MANVTGNGLPALINYRHTSDHFTVFEDNGNGVFVPDPYGPTFTIPATYTNDSDLHVIQVAGCPVVVALSNTGTGVVTSVDQKINGKCSGTFSTRLKLKTTGSPMSRTYLFSTQFITGKFTATSSTAAPDDLAFMNTTGTISVYAGHGNGTLTPGHTVTVPSLAAHLRLPSPTTQEAR